jgi:transcriptional repressor NrdR
MRCPFCKVDKDSVIDSRVAEEGRAVRRRRECLACGRRFTTYERIEQSPLKVVKKDGRRVPYERAKLQTGIELACRNLPVAADQIEALVGLVEEQLFAKYDREVPSQKIGELVMEGLRPLSEVAYVRFASVYREFKELSSFINLLEEFQRAKGQETTGRGETKRGERRGADRKG